MPASPPGLLQGALVGCTSKIHYRDQKTSSNQQDSNSSKRRRPAPTFAAWDGKKVTSLANGPEPNPLHHVAAEQPKWAMSPSNPRSCRDPGGETQRSRKRGGCCSGGGGMSEPGGLPQRACDLQATRNIRRTDPFSGKPLFRFIGPSLTHQAHLFLPRTHTRTTAARPHG